MNFNSDPNYSTGMAM